jgi:ATP-dependent Lon protease
VLGTKIRRTNMKSNDVAGVVTGLAWTSVVVIFFYRVFDFTEVRNDDNYRNLGTVMKESATIALEIY